MNNLRFRIGKRVGTLFHVHAAELLAPGGVLGAFVALGFLLRARRKRVRLPQTVRRAEQLAGALGDAVLVADGSGRIVRANDSAVRLAGTERLVGMQLAELGPDLPAVARGLTRGLASAFVAVETSVGLVRAQASLARISSRPALDLIVLRPEALAPSPPPMPPPLPIPRSAPMPSDAAGARAAIAAAAAALREPLSRAGRAASLLRLVGPPLSPRAANALGAMEAAVEDAERRTALLAAAGEGGRRGALDLAALVGDLVRAFAPRSGARVRTRLAPAFALGDDRPVRAAVREILHAAADGGGDVEIEVSASAAGPSIAIGARAVAHGATALARALVAPHGGRVEEHEGPSGRHVVKVALVPAPADAIAPA